MLEYSERLLYTTGTTVANTLPLASIWQTTQKRQFLREKLVMFRTIGLTLVSALWMCSSLAAQDWAVKMFETTAHDFGTVAAGAKAEFEFTIKNPYLEDIHIVSVTSSCGCTSPSIKDAKQTLKTYEKGAILAKFNTHQFQGARGATLTVMIDRPYPAVVQLQVKGYIRRDVVFNPGSVQFGTLDQGTGAQKVVTVNYAGRQDWQIVDVKTANPYLTAKAVPTGRQNGYVNYQLQIQLDKNAPAGYLNDHLILVTNDYRMQQVPLAIEGLVQSTGVVVNPGTLFLGVVRPGEKVTKPLVISAKRPFKIISIDCDGEGFEFDSSKLGEVKQVHVVPVTFTAGADAGKIAKTIKIVTDLGDSAPELSAYAVVSAGK